MFLIMSLTVIIQPSGVFFIRMQSLSMVHLAATNRAVTRDVESANLTKYFDQR